MSSEYVLDSENNTASPVIRSGLVWYAALLPALGLFLENYAMNKYHGYMIWGIVILARIACCFADRHILLRDGAVRRSPEYLPILPTIYIFKRCIDLKHNTAVGVVCIIALSYGIIGNGFLIGSMMDDEHIANIVKNRYAISVAEVSGLNDPVSFEEALEKSLTDISYSVEREGDVRTVTVKGKHKDTSDKYFFEFRLVHDGFALKEFRLKKVELNGDTVENDDRKKLLRDLLFPDVEFKDDSSSDSSSEN